MSDHVQPSFGRTARSRETAASIRYGGGSDGWVVPASERLVEDSEGNLASGPLGAFDYASTSGFDVTIDTGEALVGGAHLATDDQHTVTLASSANGQTVYVGWQDSAADTVIVGLDSAFTADDPKIAIWEFDTDSSTVTASTDQRTLRRTVTPAAVDAGEEVAAPTGDFERVEFRSATEPVGEPTADSGYLPLQLEDANFFEASVTSDLTAFQPISESPLTESTGSVRDVAFGGGYVAYCGDDDNVYVHNTSDWSLETTLTESSTDVDAVAFGHEYGHPYIAYASLGDGVYVHSTADWSLETTLAEGSFSYLAVTFTTSRIAYASGNEIYMHLTDEGDWELNATPTGPTGAVWDLTTGAGFLAASEDGNVYQWTTLNQPEQTLSQSSVSVNCVAVESAAYGGRFAAYGGDDDNVYVHNTSDWSLETTLIEAGGNVESVAFGDGYVAYGSADGNVYVHDVFDWSLETTLTGTTNPILSVNFGDGYVAYGSNSATTFLHQVSGINPIPVGDQGNSFLFYMEDGDGNGPYTIDWPEGTLWRGGGDAYTELPQNGNAEFVLTTSDGGSTWRASVRGEDWS